MDTKLFLNFSNVDIERYCYRKTLSILRSPLTVDLVTFEFLHFTQIDNICSYSSVSSVFAIGKFEKVMMSLLYYEKTDIKTYYVSVDG